MMAGRLDRRIKIHTMQVVRSDYGEDVATPDEGEAVWARVQPVSGNERYISQQVMAEATTQFTIRYRAGVTPEQFIAYEGRLYDILEVLEVGRSEGLAIAAVARAE